MATIPVIPTNITVHLGAPGSNAPNVTLPFVDYIKNVASSEIYSTWDEAAIRANILQYCGYKTQVMEFVDTENSLKNLLIRATLTSQNKNEKIKQEIDELMNQLGVNQTLYNLVFKDL